MSPPPDWFPTTTVANVKLRAHLLRETRAFFDARGYVEVDVPLLSHDRAVDPHMEPFTIVCDTRAGRNLYLQTSPEFGMKRLLAAGLEAIYQLSHVFRRGESGALHNPEFMMLEWYRAGDTYSQQMQFVEELVCALFSAAGRVAPADGLVLNRRRPVTPFSRTTYRSAFLRHTEADAMIMPAAELESLAIERGIQIPQGMSGADRDDWLNLLLAELVEPNLGVERPEFVYDYPASQAALARITSDAVPVAERFELYIQGIEICNGYQELTDPLELRRRISSQNERRARAGAVPLLLSSRLSDAMEYGLPESSGVALGFDRLLMFISGADKITEVVAFPFERA